MHSSLTKYKIGLGVIGLFTVVITIWAVTQASATKQDNNTYNSANNISGKLYNYTDVHDIAPYSLASIGIYNPPSTITYSRLSNRSYRFCVNYKTSSTDFSVSSTESNLLTSNVGDSNSYDSSNYSNNSYLYIDTNHHKGNNCQVVDLYNYNDQYDYSN